MNSLTSLFIFTAAAMTAFAANSLLCRSALGEADMGFSFAQRRRFRTQPPVPLPLKKNTSYVHICQEAADH